MEKKLISLIAVLVVMTKSQVHGTS